MSTLNVAEVSEVSVVESNFSWETLGKVSELNRPIDVVKTRGRPRKDIPLVEGAHKLSDVEPILQKLTPLTIHTIILDFKEYIQEGVVPRVAFENISSLYQISYAQAFSICEDSY